MLLLSENAKWYLCRSVHHEPFSGQVLGKQQAKKKKKNHARITDRVEMAAVFREIWGLEKGVASREQDALPRL